MIEEYISKDPGYKPFLIRDNWQIAKLNYLPELGIGELKKIEVHHKTDEVFILLKGTAALIAVEKKGIELSFDIVKMIVCIVYNIPKGMWHCIAMKEDAEVVIVENSNAHLGNYELYEMSKDQKKTLKAAIVLCVNK